MKKEVFNYLLNNLPANLVLNQKLTKDQIATLCTVLATDQTVNSITSTIAWGDKGAKHLAQALTTNTAIKEIHIAGHNEIHDAGACYLAEALQKNKTLVSLHISDSYISSNGAAALSVCLEKNKNLKNLSLPDNRISGAGAILLVTKFFLTSDYDGKSLDLSDNPIGLAMIIAIGALLKSHDEDISLKKNLNTRGKKFDQFNLISENGNTFTSHALGLKSAGNLLEKTALTLLTLGGYGLFSVARSTGKALKYKEHNHEQNHNHNYSPVTSNNKR